MSKAAKLLLLSSRFSEALKLYETLYAPKEDPSAANGLAICYAKTGQRDKALKILHTFEITDCIEANAVFYLQDDASKAEGLSRFAALPSWESIGDLSDDLREAYADAARERMGALPAFREGMTADPDFWENEFWSSFVALRSLSLVFSKDVGDITRYFGYVRSMFAVGLADSEVGVPTFSVFAELLARTHGESVLSIAPMMGGREARRGAFLKFYTLETDMLVKSFENLPPDFPGIDRFSEVFTIIASTFEIAGDESSARKFRMRAMEMTGGFLGEWTGIPIALEEIDEDQEENGTWPTILLN
jgi:tetratricopeptide (TPR) repeat protein